MSLTKVSYSMITGADVNVFDFLTSAEISDIQDRTKTLNVAVGVQAAMDYADTVQKPVYFPSGTYRCDAMLTVNQAAYATGRSFIGDNYSDSIIYANHTDKAAWSMVGCVSNVVSRIRFQGGDTSYPKCGILVGRSSGASAGWHTFSSVSVFNNFSVAGIYNVASEGNGWYDLFLIVTNAKYGMYVGGSDLEGIGGLTASTMVGQQCYNASIYLSSGSNTVAAVYVLGALGTGNLNWYGGYFVTNQNSYITIHTGLQDGNDTGGPICFYGVSGEPTTGTAITAVKLTAATGGVYLHQLTIINCNFLVNAGGYFVTQDSLALLDRAFILGAALLSTNAFTQIAPSTISSSNNPNCQIDVGFGLMGTGSYAAFAGPELVYNGSMELDSGWDNVAGAVISARSSTQAQSGTYSWKITTNGAYQGTQNATALSLILGRSYKVTAWVYGDGTVVNTLYVDWTGGRSYAPNCNGIAGFLFPVGWTNQTWIFTVAGAVSNARINFTQNNGGTGGTAFLDNVSITEVAVDSTQSMSTLDLLIGTRVMEHRYILTDAATVAVNAALGNYFTLNATASRTIATATNPVDGQGIDFTIYNGSGGAMTTTWGTGYKLAGAWVDPANTKYRSIRFRYNSTIVSWMEVSRTAADI